MKNAFVLSGGSIKGAFQAGALTYLLTTNVFQPDVIYGTSVGSLNGAFIADRAGRAIRQNQPVDWVQIGDELQSFWLDNITSFDIIGKKRSLLSLAYSLLRNRFESLLIMDPLYELVDQLIDPANLLAAHQYLAFYACTVDVNSGSITYASAPEYENIIDYIVASTAIPVVMPLTHIGDKAFTDGGIREVTPLKRAIGDNATRIISIVCSPVTLASKNSDWEKPMNLMDRFMSIVAHEISSNDVKQCLEINEILKYFDAPPQSGPLAGKKHIDVLAIYPEEPVALDLEDFTAEDIRLAFQQGQEAAQKAHLDCEWL